jgi:hypothetical protein
MTIAIELIKEVDKDKLDKWLSEMKQKWKFTGRPFSWFGTIDIYKFNDKTLIIADCSQMGLAGVITWARNYVAKAVIQESLKKNLDMEKHWVKEYSSEELIRTLLDNQ